MNGTLIEVEGSGPIVRPETALLTAAQFQSLAEVPPEVEWFANITNANTRRAYRNDVGEFMRFIGITMPEQFREVKRSHLIAWRGALETRALQPATIRRKLSAIASLFDYLCERNAVAFNVADGVKRPNIGSNEGKSAALGDEQAKAILEIPSSESLKGIRDRAVLSTLRRRRGSAARRAAFPSTRKRREVALCARASANAAKNQRLLGKSWSRARC
jgi:integrase/recombinase XerD